MSVIEPPGGSMFELVFPGAGERGLPLLACLGFIRLSDIGRYRTAWLEDHGDHLEIAVYTRNGGNNRPAHEDAIATMRAHPGYVRDADDAFDNTYATFYFRLNPKEEVIASSLWAIDHAEVPKPVDTTEMWHQAEVQLKNNPTKEQLAFRDELARRLGL